MSDTVALVDDLLAFINTHVIMDPSTPVACETDLLLTGLVDSVGVFEIVTWLQQTLDIEIDPTDIVIDNFRTVDRMVSLAERLRAARAI